MLGHSFAEASSSISCPITVNLLYIEHTIISKNHVSKELFLRNASMSSYGFYAYVFFKLAFQMYTMRLYLAVLK